MPDPIRIELELDPALVESAIEKSVQSKSGPMADRIALALQQKEIEINRTINNLGVDLTTIRKDVVAAEEQLEKRLDRLDAKISRWVIPSLIVIFASFALLLWTTLGGFEFVKTISKLKEDTEKASDQLLQTTPKIKALMDDTKTAQDKLKTAMDALQGERLVQLEQQLKNVTEENQALKNRVVELEKPKIPPTTVVTSQDKPNAAPTQRPR